MPRWLRAYAQQFAMSWGLAALQQLMSRQRALSGLLANLRQYCDAMPSFGLLELEYEMRTLASDLAK